jgi:hypothetical protein
MYRSASSKGECSFSNGRLPNSPITRSEGFGMEMNALSNQTSRPVRS